MVLSVPDQGRKVKVTCEGHKVTGQGHKVLNPVAKESESEE